MPNVNRLLSIALVFIAACSTTTPPPQAAPVTGPAQAEAPAEARPRRSGVVPIASAGRTCRSAVAIKATKESDGVAEETAWIVENYPGATKNFETLGMCEQKPVHKVTIDTANGQQVTIFFDVSSWAAQPK